MLPVTYQAAVQLSQRRPNQGPTRTQKRGVALMLQAHWSVRKMERKRGQAAGCPEGPVASQGKLPMQLLFLPTQRERRGRPLGEGSGWLLL